MDERAIVRAVDSLSRVVRKQDACQRWQALPDAAMVAASDTDEARLAVAPGAGTESVPTKPPVPTAGPRRLPTGAPAGPSDAARPRLDAASLSAEAAVLSARESATAAATLDDLRAMLEKFDGCSLKTT